MVVSYILINYGLLFLIALLAYSIGKRILISFEFDSAWDDFSFSSGLGLGIIIFLVMALGFTQVLYKWAVILAFIICVILCLPVYKSWLGCIKTYFLSKPPLLKHALLAVLLIIILLGIFLPILKLPLYPTTRFDALSYHLPYAKAFSNWHGIGLTQYSRFPVFTLNMEMLFTLMMVLHDQIGAQLVHFLCLGISVTTIIGWGLRLQSIKSGLFAAALLFSTPQVFMLAGSTYPAFGIALFVTLGIYSWMNWMNKREDRWLVLSAVFIGLSVGMKYSALFFLIALGLVSLFYDIRARRLKYSMIFLIVAIVIGCPWYIRNALYTGNPVFPFFGTILGLGQWNETDLVGITREMTSHGTGKTFLSFLTMPWNLVYNYDQFVENFPMTKLWLYALPLVVVFGNFKSSTRWLLAFCFAYFIFWFMSAQQLRYLEPIFPLLALLFGVSIEMPLTGLPFLKKHLSLWIVTGLIIAWILYPGVRFAWISTERLGPLPVTTEQYDSFIQDKYLTYNIYKKLNVRHGSDYRIYSVNDAEMRFYCDGTFMGDWFGEARFRSIINYGEGGGHRFKGSEEVFRILRSELDADYLLLRQGPLKPLMPIDEFFTEHFLPEGMLYYADTGKTSAILFSIVD